MKPLISIVIPAYNEEKYIEETITSILNNDYQNFEIIVVCNGCTDKTEAIVKKYKNIRLTILKKPDVATAKNKGAQLARGKFLVFLDADTKLAKNAIQTMINILTKKNVIGTLRVLPDINKLKAKFLMQMKNIILFFKIYKTSNGIVFCRKELFNKINGFKENLKKHEDGIFVRTAAKLTQFKYSNSSHVILSMRRYEKLGYLNVTKYWYDDWKKRKLKGIMDEEYSAIR